MAEKRERVIHPSWCDREHCTAPEFRPTNEEYRGGASGSHYSATLGSRTNDLQIFLAQSVCPWETEAYLVLRNGEDGMLQTVSMSDTGGGFALYALLGQEVTELVRKYPALYAERFPYVQRAIEERADEATADAVMPRDPVELQEQMNAEQEETDRTADWSSRERLHTIAAYEIADQAAEELLRDVERAAQDATVLVKQSTRDYAEQLRSTPGKASADGHTGWECDKGASLIVEASTPGPGKLGTHHGVIYACAGHRAAAVERITGAGYEVDPRPAPPGHRWNPWPCGHVTAHGAESLTALCGDQEAKSTPEASHTKPLYTLVVNGKKSVWGSFRDVQGAVVQMVTTRLGAEPDRLAEEAGTMAMAFNSGVVQEAVDERGEWYSVFDAFGEEQIRIRITKE